MQKLFAGAFPRVLISVHQTENRHTNGVRFQGFLNSFRTVSTIGPHERPWRKAEGWFCGRRPQCEIRHPRLAVKRRLRQASESHADGGEEGAENLRKMPVKVAV